MSLLFKSMALAATALSILGSVDAMSHVTVNGSRLKQSVDGFGFSGAFGTACELKNNVPAADRQIVLDLLFGHAGARFTILRNLFPSASWITIEPTSPGTPDATPTYRWDSDSWCQIWLSQQAMSYGVSTIYGNAWSAPSFMKTNNDESNGGQICGMPGAANCTTGDWRQAYANYLVQYVKNYASSGVPLTHVGALNEPDLDTSYSSMFISPAQAVDFVKILGATLVSNGLTTKVVCCDAEGWNNAKLYTSAIAADATALRYVKVFSGHGYTNPPNSALTGAAGTGRSIWMTEWSKYSEWTAAWDDGSDSSGYTWAQYLYTGFTKSHLNAFVYWYGIDGNTTDNGALMRYQPTGLEVSKRFWALATYSRFARPGGSVVSSTSVNRNLQVLTFKNRDGSTAITVLNAAYSDVTINFTLISVSGTVVHPYLTNEANSIAAQSPIAISGGGFTGVVPPRALIVFNIPKSTTRSSKTTTHSSKTTTHNSKATMHS
ncbi:glycoside hydrolase, partial [Jimgerdemannia flammicorona]